MLVIAVGCDREKGALPPEQKAAKDLPSRASDAAYLNRLKDLRNGQKKAASERNDIEKKMELERKRARAALGEKATDEQVLAELESNPVKYPQWKYLVGSRNAAEGELKNAREKARTEIVARLAREQRELEAAGASANSPKGAAVK